MLAVYLGASGLGVFNVLSSSVSLISTLTGFGLSFSVVRNLSEANSNNNSILLSKTINVFLRWTIVSGSLGGVIVFLGANKLSFITFNTLDYSAHYMWLSIVLFITPLQVGLQAILQGTRRIKHIAASSMLASVINVVLIIPIYLFLSDDGIVPAMILSVLLPFFIRIYYVNKIDLKKTTVSFSETISIGSNIISMGITFMLISFMASGVTILTNVYITKFGSLSELGLFRGGMAITNQSIGLIFTAISVDYFPRLSAVSNDNLRIRKLANEQTEIVVLLATPIIVALIVLSPEIISLLLSPQFYGVSIFVRVVSIAIFIRAVAYSLDLITYAKGDKLLSFILALWGNGSLLLWIIFGYKAGGINGIAVGLIGHYFFTLVVVYYILKLKYSFGYKKKTIRSASFNFGLVILAASAIFTLPISMGYVVSGGILIISLYNSVKSLNKLVDLQTQFLKLFKK